MFHRRNKAKTWPFGHSGKEGEDNITVNQRMVRKLIKRKTRAAQLAPWQVTSLTGLGIEVSQSRDENVGTSLKEAARRGGLDPAFLAIVESGKALPEEITKDVLKSLSRSVKSDSKSLKSAMAIRESGVLERDHTGQITSAWISLCSQSFLNQVAAITRSRHDQSTDNDFPISNDFIWTGQRIESLSPPTLRFFAFEHGSGEFGTCSVSVWSGLEQILSGSTDEEGRCTFPSNYKKFPENSHIVISHDSSDRQLISGL